MIQIIEGHEVVKVNSQRLLVVEPFLKVPTETETELFQEAPYNGMIEEIKSGPEAVSLDFTFAKESSLYGLPERIDRLRIEDTV